MPKSRPNHPAPPPRMTRKITLTLLGAAVLTTGLFAVSGCGRRAGADHTWYDAGGNVVAQNWTTDPSGKRVPAPHPFDRHGRAWVYDATGALVPPPPPATAYTTSRRSGTSWLWGGSGYRSFGGSPAPATRPPSGGATPSATTHTPSGGSTPSAATHSQTVTRGGFGSTAARVSSSGS